jgi:hypothetical protein
VTDYVVSIEVLVISDTLKIYQIRNIVFNTFNPKGITLAAILTMLLWLIVSAKQILF